MNALKDDNKQKKRKRVPGVRESRGTKCLGVGEERDREAKIAVEEDPPRANAMIEFSNYGCHSPVVRSQLE